MLVFRVQFWFSDGGLIKGDLNLKRKIVIKGFIPKNKFQVDIIIFFSLDMKELLLMKAVVCVWKPFSQCREFISESPVVVIEMTPLQVLWRCNFSWNLHIGGKQIMAWDFNGNTG